MPRYRVTEHRAPLVVEIDAQTIEEAQTEGLLRLHADLTVERLDAPQQAPPATAVRASCPPVHVRLEHDADGRKSPDYGPYEYVQMMYGLLRGILLHDPKTEEVIAEFEPDTGLWRGQDRKTYSDMIIFTPMIILPEAATPPR